MAHVTFIHGISNKPPADVLLKRWLQALAASGGPDLGAAGVTAEMVYWADVLYEQPVAEESIADEGPEVVETDFGGLAIVRAPTTARADEASFSAGLAMKFGMVAAAAEAADSVRNQLEWIPLPDPLKRRLMEAYLRDAHHYLYNVTFSPRPGVRFAVQDEIRDRTVRALMSGAARPGPHIVVCHSMGTVIAYDCLKRVTACPAIDGLLTIGSPLGLDEVQERLQPEWTRADGFPRERLRGPWINIFDRLDPVAGFDPVLANDFRRGGSRAVIDEPQSNTGRWRHDISKYFAGSPLRGAVRTLLRL
jgi:hypothetical protein